MQKEYISIGKIDREILKKINIKLITEEVVFTFERIKHVTDKRPEIYDEVKTMLPIVIEKPDYIYNDWNNRNNTLVFIKQIDTKSKLNIVIKVAVENDGKHSKNSIITLMKIGEKTFKKIYNNKYNNLLFEKLDKNE